MLNVNCGELLVILLVATIGSFYYKPTIFQHSPYAKYLTELRARLLKCFLVFAAICALCISRAETIYTHIAMVLLNQLPYGSTLIATKVTSTFMIPINVSCMFAVLLCMPFFLHQIWAFVAPALHTHEKKSVAYLLLSTTALFYLGLAFGFWVICPLALGFFAQCTPYGVTLMADIGHYLDFVTSTLLAAGIAFQIPIITKVIIHLNLISKESLISKRRHVIVLAFILGMLLAPPDVVSQILLALPIWGLFELGILVS